MPGNLTSEIWFNPLTQESIQRRFLDLIFHKRNIVGMFPASYPTSALYMLPALTGQLIGVVVCPDKLDIQRHMEYFKRNGIDFPQVAVLDGTQPAFHEREVTEHIKHREVRLLYTTPEKFATVAFLQLLIRANVSFLVIENAQFLLNGFTGFSSYNKLVEGLESLHRKPPIVLLTHPLPTARIRELTKKLSLKNFEVVQKEPVVERTAITVKRLLNEKEKMHHLVEALKQWVPLEQSEVQAEAQTHSDRREERPSGKKAPAKSKVRPPASIIIHTLDTRICEKLCRALIHYGFDSVYAYHSELSWPEALTIERIFYHSPHTIIVTTGVECYFLKKPATQNTHIVQWNCCMGIEELFAQVFRNIEMPNFNVSGLVLYSKEDFKRWTKRVTVGEWNPDDMGPEEPQQVSLSSQTTKAFRNWVLSEECRYKSLLSHWLGTTEVQVPECGTCDRCLTHSYGVAWESILKYWLY